jgi:hypothetical protein
MAGPVNLRVEDTDGRGPGGEIVFEYHSVMTPSRMIPSSGPLMGGGFVTVGAMGMVPMDQEVHCMFTGSGSDEQREVIAGRLVWGGSIMCVAPAWKVQGAVGVEVSINGGADYSHGGLKYWYEESPSVSSLKPMTIWPSVVKADVMTVTVYGKHFKAERDLTCRLGANNHVSEEVYVSSTRIMCGLTAQGGKNAVFEVNNNGQDYIRDGVGLKMVRGRFNRRISIVPSTGPTLGGMLVTILGIETNDEDETGITVGVVVHGSVDRVRRVEKTGALVFVAPSVSTFET